VRARFCFIDVSTQLPDPRGSAAAAASPSPGRASARCRLSGNITRELLRWIARQRLAAMTSAVPYRELLGFLHVG